MQVYCKDNYLFPTLQQFIVDNYFLANFMRNFFVPRYFLRKTHCFLKKKAYICRKICDKNTFLLPSSLMKQNLWGRGPFTTHSV
mgnify:CR=1 FL=1